MDVNNITIDYSPSATTPPPPPPSDPAYSVTTTTDGIPILLIVAAVLVLFAIGYFAFTKSASSSSDKYFDSDNSSSFSSPSMFIILFLFLLFLAINAAKYFFQFDVVTHIKNLFTTKPQIDVVVNSDPLKKLALPHPVRSHKKQVFNIPENIYGYEDAKALCKAYGARLATYQEVEDSYNSGGEWCNYGWSEGQMALFPTQQKTYDHLQTVKGHEHDCGRPGVNGGYMANPLLQYGVNCYGTKPKMTDEEKILMEETPIYPKTAEDILLDKRTEYWKEKLDGVIVSPFNKGAWSRY